MVWNSEIIEVAGKTQIPKLPEKGEEGGFHDGGASFPIFIDLFF